MRPTLNTRAVILGVLLLASPSAWAVTFDFAQWAVDNGERGFENSSPFSMTVGGLTVTATASFVPPDPTLPLAPLGV